MPPIAVVLVLNGVETTLVARSRSVDFSRIKPKDTIESAIIKGQVPAYAVQ